MIKLVVFFCNTMFQTWKTAKKHDYLKKHIFFMCKKTNPKLTGLQNGPEYQIPGLEPMGVTWDERVIFNTSNPIKKNPLFLYSYPEQYWVIPVPKISFEEYRMTMKIKQNKQITCFTETCILSSIISQYLD